MGQAPQDLLHIEQPPVLYPNQKRHSNYENVPSKSAPRRLTQPAPYPSQSAPYSSSAKKIISDPDMSLSPPLTTQTVPKTDLFTACPTWRPSRIANTPLRQALHSLLFLQFVSIFNCVLYLVITIFSCHCL